MICPQCNQTTMVQIVYGIPTPMLIELSQRDEIVLGGPVHKEFTHFCHHCQDTHPSSELI
jgi:putative AlgH/UPF0301 family transcriptional regulator